ASTSCSSAVMLKPTWSDITRRSAGAVDEENVLVYRRFTMTKGELRNARAKLGMNQTELGEAIGMQKNSIARMERGERPIMKHTELSVKYLLLNMKKNKKEKK